MYAFRQISAGFPGPAKRAATRLPRDGFAVSAIRRTVVSGLLVLGLAACAGDSSGTYPELFTGLGANDLTARYNEPGGKYGTVTAGGDNRPKVYSGEGAPTKVRGGDIDGDGTADPALIPEGDGFILNFENVEVAAIAKAILGDLLAVNYTVDQRATGTVSISSARPIPRDKVVTVLETTLKAVNIAVVKEGGTYRVTPSSEALGTGAVEIGKAGEGYGTTIIPVRHVSAQTVARVLESFASRPGALKVDPATNYVLVQGTAAERRAVVDAAGLVDADWMKQQNVGIFPLANSSPETIIAELGKILDTGEGGLSQGQVQMQPMNRLNAVLVVSKRKETVDTVGRWVKRLDRNDPLAAGVKVYRLKYAQAKNVAALLNDVFGGRGGSSTSHSRDRDALEPGGGSGSLHSSGTGTGTGSGSFGSSGSGSGSGSSFGGSGSGNSRVSAAFGSFGTGGAGGQGGGGGDAPSGTGDTAGGAGGSGGASSILGGGAGAAGGSGALPNVRIAPDIPNNSLLIYANAADYKQVERTIRELDRPPTQVAIEATIAEVTLTDDLSYGVQFFLKSANLGLGKNNGTAGLTTGTSQSLVKSFPGFNLLLGQASDPRVLLTALRGMTNVKILSSPSLVVIDNQPAVLQVGDQVPITTRSATSVTDPAAPIVNNVEFRDTGIILKVLPRVNANGVVTLDIEQEISNVADRDRETLTPTIAQRRIRSQIAVSSGQTILLAGLITERQEKSRSGIPGIVEIKLLNELLSSNTNLSKRTELIIFIKPQIMRDPVDAQTVSEEFRARMTNIRQPQNLPR